MSIGNPEDCYPNPHDEKFQASRMTDPHGADSAEIERLAEVSRQRAILLVQSQAKGWHCDGDDRTEYDNGRDEGFRLAVVALGLLDPFGDEIRAALRTPPDDAVKLRDALEAVRACRRPGGPLETIHGLVAAAPSWNVAGLTKLLPDIDAALKGTPNDGK